MRIVSLFAENFKRLTAVEITPDGAVVQITGANGSGKSSVLDALFVALAGKKAADPVPVRVGQETATIKLDLGKIRVTRKFRADGETTLFVEAEDGARYSSPQTMLDKLLGTLTFDPLEFSRMDAKGQSGALRTLVPLAIDVDQLTRENEVDFAARTGVNRQIRELAPREKAAREAMPAEAPALIDVYALIEKMRGATEYNAAIERQRLAHEADRHAVADGEQKIADIDAQIARLKRERDRLEDALRHLQDVVALHVAPDIPIDTAALADQIQSAQASNRIAEQYVRDRDNCQRLEHDLGLLEQQSSALTITIGARQRDIQSALAAAKMPVDGLAFSESFDVLYNGLPFQQASGAEQLRVSVAIAMAMNPKLRVLRIKDGSLLDEKNLAMLAEMAELADYQIWIERVEESGSVGVVMEDGAVRTPATTITAEAGV